MNFKPYPARWPVLAIFAGLGLLVWLLLPAMVIPMDDDFWYLRSVVKTIQKGRPWTDEWLTPWAASSSVISAAIYKLTGSFTLAIHLQLAAAAGLAGAAMTLFLREQGLGRILSAGASLLILLCPTILFMFLMYTGVALYLACLWWCLLLAERRLWGWFFLPWALAIASRQSAVVWLALPGWNWLLLCVRSRTILPRTPETRVLASVFAGATAFILLLRVGMNPTEGQKLVVKGLAGVLSSGGMHVPLALGAVAAAAGLGVTCLLRLPATITLAQRGRKTAKIVVVLVGAGAGAWAIPWFVRTALNTHDCYRDPFTAFWLSVMGAALGGALGLHGRHPLRGDALCAALGSWILVILYSGTFDYYYIELFSFFMVAGWPQAHRKENQISFPAGSRGYMALALVATALALGMFIWHGRSLIRIASQQDRIAAVVTLYEQALREDRLQPHEVGLTTFGYHGWLFQDYYAAHEGRDKPLLGGFIRYGQPWDGVSGTGVLTEYPRALRSWRGVIPTRNNASLKAAPHLSRVGSLEFPLLHFFTARYDLVRRPEAERENLPISPEPASYQRRPFPLNDPEWRQLIEQANPL